MKKDEIIINEEYMDWLEKFSDKHQKFYDDEYVFYSDDLNDDDKKNISYMSCFFDLIRDFAKNHFIVSLENDNLWCYYNIRYNDKYYMIGKVVDSIYCLRKDNIEEEFINFNAIMNYLKQKDSIEDKKKINSLKKMLDYLVSSGISPKVIEDETKKVLRKKRL